MRLSAQQGLVLYKHSACPVGFVQSVAFSALQAPQSFPTKSSQRALGLEDGGCCALLHLNLVGVVQTRFYKDTAPSCSQKLYNLPQADLLDGLFLEWSMVKIAQNQPEYSHKMQRIKQSSRWKLQLESGIKYKQLKS
eukprot:1158561-Pelagomonas_calceolata.AAC.2